MPVVDLLSLVSWWLKYLNFICPGGKIKMINNYDYTFHGNLKNVTKMVYAVTCEQEAKSDLCTNQQQKNGTITPKICLKHDIKYK